MQLPIFNEQFVVDRLIQACCNLDYPADKLEIQVLDDSTDGTVEVAQAAVELYQSLGHRIVYIHRVNRHGFKAGALDEGLRVATGEFVAIFDADFVPPREWLMQVVHHFADPKIGMVQTRWTHLNRDYSFLTQVEAILLDGHFILEHGGRSRTNAFFNFNGTAGMWRRAAIDGSGGWQHDTLTEDTDLSYRAQMKGWKFLYLQDVECPAELPVEMTAFKTQQARWAKGLIQTSKKILPMMFRSDAPFHVKLEAFYHLTANHQLSADDRALHAVDAGHDHPLLSGMVSNAADRRSAVHGVNVFHLFVLSGFAKRAISRPKWYRTFLYLPFLMALGIGLTMTNTKAVLEALFGIKTAFKRTPKYRIEKRGQIPQASKYRKRLGIVPWIELLIGSYFALTIWYAIVNENYFTVPFLLLFVLGYWYTGLMSLLEGRFERFRIGSQCRRSLAQALSRGRLRRKVALDATSQFCMPWSTGS